MKTFKIALALAGSVVAMPAMLQAKAAPAGAVKNIVLVHGAYADGAGWRGVYDILIKDGYRVSVVAQPLSGLAEDVAATRRVLAQQDGPVVLVGHSYGGMIITDAGDDPKVKALVYVAALQPEVGDSVFSLGSSMSAPSNDVKKSGDGYLMLAPDKFAADFAADVPPALSEFMARSQMPVAEAAFAGKAQVAPWHMKPSYSIVATEDKTLNPDLQRWMYTRAGARVTEIKGSHAVFLSQPRAVADVIERAASEVK